jgi:histone acetyltransferase 1
VTYSAKFPASSAVQADDPEKILYEYIPPSYAKSEDAFKKTVDQDAADFVPIGTRVGAYRLVERGDSKGKGKGKAKKSLPERGWELLEDADVGEDDEILYVAFRSDWSTPGFKEFHRRMQIFVLLYIEGAQYIDEEDSRWEFITL